MSRSRPITLLISLLTTLVLLAACGSAEPDGTAPEAAPGEQDPVEDDAGEPVAEGPEPTALEELIAAADEEGVLYYGDSVAPEILAEINDRFNERWGTDITIELVSGRATDLAVRMQQEAAVGRHTIDSTHLSTGLVFGALEHDMFDRDFDYIGTFEDELPGIRDVVERVPEALRGYGLEGQHLARVVAYNTDLVADEDVPQSWDDLLDERWSGRRIALDPAGSSTVQNVAGWDDERVLQYSLDITEQEPLWVTGDEIFEGLARGETEIAIGTAVRLGNLLNPANWPDAPVALAPVEFVPVAQQMIVIAKDAPNINAARLYAAWQATEGFAHFIELGNQRERVWPDSGTWAAEQLAELGVEVIMLDTEELIERADEMRTAIIERYRQMGIDG